MSPASSTPAAASSRYRRHGKRAFDLAAAGVLFLLFLPLVLLIAIAVLLAMGRPVLFRHDRPGWHGRSFTLYKFRTMKLTDGHDPHGSDIKRLTPFGAWLRRTSLDELPELWNVLRGDMSLVGPRPLLQRYLPRYTERQARRHEVRPGITGWAQVNGRNALSWEERLDLDVWYVDHLRPGLDARILFMTVATVFTGRGVTAPDHATMPEFKGPEK